MAEAHMAGWLTGSYLMLERSSLCSSVTRTSGRTDASHSTLFSAAYCFSTLKSFSFTSGSSPRICSTWGRHSGDCHCGVSILLGTSRTLRVFFKNGRLRLDTKAEYLPVEFQSFVLAVQSHSVSPQLTALNADPEFLPGAQTQHPQAERPALGGLDQRRRRLVLPDRDAVDLHDEVAGPEPSTACWRARRAVLHQQRAVTYDGEPKTTIRTWYDVHLAGRSRKWDNVGYSWSSVIRVYW